MPLNKHHTTRRNIITYVDLSFCSVKPGQKNVTLNGHWPKKKILEKRDRIIFKTEVHTYALIYRQQTVLLYMNYAYVLIKNHQTDLPYMNQAYRCMY